MITFIRNAQGEPRLQIEFDRAEGFHLVKEGEGGERATLTLDVVELVGIAIFVAACQSGELERLVVAEQQRQLQLQKAGA